MQFSFEYCIDLEEHQSTHMAIAVEGVVNTKGLNGYQEQNEWVPFEH